METIIIIDEEFLSLLPALDRETYASLEEIIISHGCRDSLVVWNDILIDGYNRYDICTKHDIPFNTVSKEFDSREEVLIWIISNQVSRRNLSQAQLSYFRGLHYKADKKIQGTNNQYVQQSENSQNGTFQKSTAERLAERYNVSRNTIMRDAQAAAAIDAIGAQSPIAKRKILSGEVGVKKKVLEGLSSSTTGEIGEVAAAIENGTFENKKTSGRVPPELAEPVDLILAEMRPLDTVVSKMSNAFSSGLPKITKKGDRSKIKATLRSYIDTLEDLYKNI